MRTKTETRDAGSPRERLLAAAAELFYLDGVNAVGIDKIIDRAGVAKASLYAHFKSKDELVRAYLGQRQEARRARIEARLATLSQPRDKLLAVYDVLGDVFAQPNFRGCAFLRANAEVQADSGAREACDSYRQWIRTLFTELCRQAGASDPDQLARQLLLLYDGASVSAQMDGDFQAAAVARAIAEQILSSVLAANA